MALSATIRNAMEVRDWWQATSSREVRLEIVRERFINLQRHVWSEEKKELVMLHPCAALTRQQIIEEGFTNGDLAFTARERLQSVQGDEEALPKSTSKISSSEKCIFPKDEGSV